MVEDKDDGTFGRHPLRSRDLDAAEEDPQHRAEQWAQQSPHAINTARGRDSSHAAYVQMSPPSSTATGIISTA